MRGVCVAHTGKSSLLVMVVVVGPLGQKGPDSVIVYVCV